MDAQDWDRISDLLMQIRKKVDNLLPTTKKGEWTREHYLNLVAELLRHTDTMAEIDGKGWL